MKRVVSIFMVAVMVLCSNIFAFAETNGKASSNTIVLDNNYVESLVNELKQIDYNDTEEVEKMLKNHFHNSIKKSKKFAVNLTASRDTSVNNPKISFLRNKTYILNDGTEVTFENLDGFGIVTIVTDKNKTVIDENNNIVDGKIDLMSRKRSKGSIYKVKGDKDFKAYAILGNTLFTVTIDYKFRSRDGKITVKEGEGYIAPGFLSAWTGSVWTDKENASAPEKAYVKAYGTASWSIPIAKLFGIGANIQSVNYKAYVYCDKKCKISTKIKYKRK